VPLHPYAGERGCEDVEGSSERAGQDTNGFRHGDGMRVGDTSGVDDAGHETRVRGKDEDRAVNDVDELLRVVQRKVTVKGSGGVVATVVVTARRGKVWMSIQPPFTWDAIMEPGMVDELIRTLAPAAEDAKKMVSGTRRSRGGSCPPTGGARP